MVRGAELPADRIGRVIGRWQGFVDGEHGAAGEGRHRRMQARITKNIQRYFRYAVVNPRHGEPASKKMELAERRANAWWGNVL